MLKSELAEIGTWSMHLHTGMVESDANLRRIFGLPLDLASSPLEAFVAQVHPDDQAGLAAAIEAVVGGDAGDHFEAAYRTVRDSDVREVVARGHLEKDDEGTPLRLRGVVVDVTNRRAAELALSAEKQILELIATGSPTDQTLDHLVRSIESQSSDGMLVSILVLDASGTRLVHGAAPSLPRAYCDQLYGVALGPGVGYCATAAYTGEPVMVSDTANDPAWAEFKHIALRFGLAACCAFPVFSSTRNLLGTIAMYYGKPHTPSSHDQQLMETANYLAGIILERARAVAALEYQIQEFQLLVNAIPQLAWMAEPNGHVFWFNERWYEYTGKSPQEMVDGGWKAVHDAKVLPTVVRRWEHSIATGTPFEMEFPLLGGDGVFRTFLTQAQPIRDSQGRVIRWFGTNTDVDESRKYREERERLLGEAERSRLEATDLSQQLTSERDKLREANQQLTGYNNELISLGDKLRREQEAQAEVAYYLRTANRAAAQFGVTDSVAQMVEILQNMLVSTFRAKAAGIWHRGKDPNLLERVANHGLGDASSMVSAELDIRYNSFKPCWVARYGRPFAGPTERADLQFDQAWLESTGVTYAGIYPLLARNRVVGVMGYFGDSELPSAIPEVLSTVAAVYGSHLNSLYELESSGKR